DEIKNMPKVTFIKFLQMKRALDLVVMGRTVTTLAEFVKECKKKKLKPFSSYQ
ncbi:13045_t:CDS:2, partial [Dentiscutata erythropus]